MKIDVKIKLSNNAKLPKYQTEFSSGLDLYSNETVTIYPGQIYIFNTGISIEMPLGYEGQVRSRSGLSSKYGLFIINGVGTIDQDYRGEIKIPILNSGKDEYTVISGDRIAQLVFSPVSYAKLIICDDLSDTNRGENGFGSTGK
jgi:dUTP pyrophosphatase